MVVFSSSVDRNKLEGEYFPKAIIAENQALTTVQIEVTFQIHGSGNLHGDGMAIWVTKERATPGPVFGSMDRFEGLGVFIDTYKNSRPGIVFPYVMAMLGNSSVTYDKGHDGNANELSGCSVNSIVSASGMNH